MFMGKSIEMERIQVGKIEVSKCNLSHPVSQSSKFGYLIPSYVDEYYPGDICGINIESLTRVAPLIAPKFGRWTVKYDAFFVPYRLLWDNFIYWAAGEMAPGVETPHVCPYIELSEGEYNGLTALQKKFWDYMGLPAFPSWGTGTTKVKGLAMVAYNKIWNDWFRAEHIIDPIEDKVDDGEMDFTAFLNLKFRAWSRDLFTSALPDPQQGDPIDIPLGKVTLDPTLGVSQKIRAAADHSLVSGAKELLAGTSGDIEANDIIDFPVVIDPNNTWDVGATTINDLRLAWIVQKWKEKNMRGGTRFPELLQNHFGVKVPDYRLDRSQHLFSIETPIKVGEVVSTATTTSNPQGNMAGHGLAFTNGGYRKFFIPEHGVVMILQSVVAEPVYQQGIPRHYLNYNEAIDSLMWPSFSHIGEEAVLNEEIAAWQGSANKDAFAYQPRYYWLKSKPGRVAGDFKTTLKHWTDARIFTTPPALNEEFINCNPSTRAFAVEDGTDYLWHEIYFNIQVIRRLPAYSTPY